MCILRTPGAAARLDWDLGGPVGVQVTSSPLSQAAGLPLEAAPLLVDDLHAKRFLIFVFVVVDINKDLLLPSSLTGCKPQADGVGLSSPNLQTSTTILVPTPAAPLSLPVTSTHKACVFSSTAGHLADRGPSAWGSCSVPGEGGSGAVPCQGWQTGNTEALSPISPCYLLSPHSRETLAPHLQKHPPLTDSL